MAPSGRKLYFLPALGPSGESGNFYNICVRERLLRETRQRLEDYTFWYINPSRLYGYSIPEVKL